MDRSLNAGPNGAVYLVSAARTPIGKFAGALADVPATALGGIAIAAAVERAGVPTDSIDEVLMGQVLQAGVGNAELVDATVHDGLWCAIEHCHMGTHAERVAIHDHVSREDQDRFALESHQKAIAAIDAGRFDAEIVPVPVRTGKTETLVTTDEGPRRDTSLEALARLRPVFPLPV